MSSFSNTTIVGRLVRDPELRYTSGGLAVASFTIAVDRRFKEQGSDRPKTDFFNCSAFRQTAEFITNNLVKGQLILASGEINFNEVEGKDGVKRIYTTLVANDVRPFERGRPRDQAEETEEEVEEAPVPQKRQASPPRSSPRAARPQVEEYDEEETDPFSDE